MLKGCSVGFLCSGAFRFSLGDREERKASEGVQEFWRVWWGKGQQARAVFYCKMQDESELVIRPRAKRECSEEDHGDIRWDV